MSKLTKVLEVSVQEFENIKGKKLKYLLIGKEPNRVVMNIGDGSYNAIVEVMNDEVMQESADKKIEGMDGGKDDELKKKK